MLCIKRNKKCPVCNVGYLDKKTNTVSQQYCRDTGIIVKQIVIECTFCKSHFLELQDARRD